MTTLNMTRTRTVQPTTTEGPTRTTQPVQPPRETGPVVPTEERGPSALDLVALALNVGTLVAIVGTSLLGMLLGPFAFLLVFLIPPLYVAWAAASWLAEWASGVAERRAVSLPPSGARQAAEAPPRPAPPAPRATFRTKLREVQRELARVHHSLPALLAAVKAQTDPLHTLLQLRVLRGKLEEHFRLEEAPGGLFEELRSMSEGFEPDLIALTDQHEAILADLDALLDLEPRDEPLPTAVPSVDRVLERVATHQRSEDALIQQAYGFRIDGELEG